MLGLANVCELAEINNNVWMNTLGGRMGNKPGKNPLNFIAEQEKIFTVTAVLLVPSGQLCSFYLRNVLMYVYFDAMLTW